MTTPAGSLRARAPLVAALVALLVGAGARSTGLDWGHPYLLHIDELGYNFHAAARMEYRRATEGWWRPGIISYGAVPQYAFIALKNVLFGSARARRHAATASSEEAYLRSAYGFDPSDRGAYHWPDVALAMRALAAVLYTLAAVLGWRAATVLWGPREGALAAVAGAGCAGLVQHAHYFTPEAFLTVGGAALLHACARIAAWDRWRDYAYAAAAMALVASSKVTSAPLCALVLVAAYQARRGRPGGTPCRALAETADHGRLWAAVAGSIAAWFVINPAALRHMDWYFDPATQFSPLEQVRAYRWGAPLPDWALFYTDKPRWYFLTTVLADACGGPLRALALAGTLAVLLVERGAGRLPALFALVALAPLTLTRLQTIRYVVPALPFVLVCAARAVDLALGAARAARTTWARGAAVGAVLAGGLALAHGTLVALAQANMYRGVDNRVRAARWLRARVRPGDRVILEDHPCYGPPLGNEWGEGQEVGARAVGYERLWVGGEDPAAVARWLEGARFIVLNGWNLRLVDVPEARRRHPGRTAFYARVRRLGAPPGYRRVAAFEDGPRLAGWHRDERHSEILHVAFDHVPLYVYERVARQP